MFSNSYANVPVDTWSASWDQANVADIQIGGNSTKKYSNLVFSGIEFTSAPINATSMTNFHMDIWTPDATTFHIKLVDFGADGFNPYKISDVRPVGIGILIADGSLIFIYNSVI